MRDDEDNTPDLFGKIKKDMMAGLTEPRARLSDPDTSHKAAGRVKISAKSDRRRVLLTHYAYREGGLTDFELAAILKRQQTSVGKRRGDLRDAGYVKATTDRRAAPSGSPAIVWAITEKGIVEAKRQLH